MAELTKVEAPVKKMHTEPWKPSQLLAVKEMPGWRLRWVRKDLLERKVDEGWEPVKAKDLTDRTIIDGAQVDSLITKRNLILCRMPESLAKSRDAHYAGKSRDAIKETVRTFEESGDKGLSYGSIKVSHGSEGGG